MKTKFRILIWLAAWIVLFLASEISLNNNWRAFLPLGALDELVTRFSRRDLSPSTPSLKVIHVAGADRYLSTQGLHVSVESGSLDHKSKEIVSFIRDICCNRDTANCKGALRKLSDHYDESPDFWIVHDPQCENDVRVVFDQVMFHTRSFEGIVKEWDISQVNPPEGPFGSDKGLAVIRFFLVDSRGRASTQPLEWNPSRFLRDLIAPFTSKISPLVEIIFDSQVVYSADGGMLLGSLDDSVDMYDRSRIINEELEVLTGPSHLLEIGAHAIPPLRNIAIVLGPHEQGLYNVTEWGVLNFVNGSFFTECLEESCRVSLNGEQAISNTIISVIRHWLGLASAKCIGDCEQGRFISRTEMILLSHARRDALLNRTIQDCMKQLNVLKALPRLRFPEHVSRIMVGAVSNATAALDDPDIFKSVSLAKIASMKAGEVLHHELVSAPPSFSLEYMFALYAPAGLPIVFPVIMGFIEIFKKRKSRVKVT